MSFTEAQFRELNRVFEAGDSGSPQGTGPAWSVRARLKGMGLVELRAPDPAKDEREQNPRWFMTEAGKAAYLEALKEMTFCGRCNEFEPTDNSCVRQYGYR